MYISNPHGWGELASHLSSATVEGTPSKPWPNSAGTDLLEN
jgi:hypothetical protein